MLTQLTSIRLTIVCFASIATVMEMSEFYMNAMADKFLIEKLMKKLPKDRSEMPKVHDDTCCSCKKVLWMIYEFCKAFYISVVFYFIPYSMLVAIIMIEIFFKSNVKI